MSEILAITAKGLDYLLADEIKQLLPEVEAKMGLNSVSFAGDLAAAYKLCLHSNLASKVLWHLNTGPAENDKALYDLVQQIDWALHLKPTGSLAVDFVGTSGTIRNTQYGAVKVKDAIVDQFIEDGNSRPDVEKYRPDIRLHVRLNNRQASIYIDLSGEGLHQRGYRSGTGAAPIKEHIACAMLLRSGWLESTDKPLLDPCCGSGTILIEAARMAKNIAAGLSREYWGFNGWLGHQSKTWQHLLSEAQLKAESAESIPQSLTLLGSDIDGGLIEKARKNIANAGFVSDIKLVKSAAENLDPACVFGIETSGFVVTNPPYGERMGEMPELLQLYSVLGNNLKRHFANWQLAVLCSDPGLLKQLKLGYKKQYKINNGNIECVLNTYQVGENEQIKESASVNTTFANRLSKNIKSLKGWVKQQNINCYRIYDADIPEFNVAIDRYDTETGSYLVVYEYAAPKDIPESVSKQRLQEVVFALPSVTDVAADKIILKVREKQRGKAQYQKLNKKRKQLVVKEGRAELLVNLWDYLDTGLFLDHRRTRELFASKCSGKHVLNLFAYTGSVSVHAALNGAKTVTTVDMSNTYVDWAKDNFRQNRLNDKKYRFEQADCLTWLRQCAKKYDAIFIDPPTFSNSKRMENNFDVQRDYLNLILDTKRLLSADGFIMFTNNKRHFKMDAQAMEQQGLIVENISKDTLPKDFARNPQIHNSWLITLKK